MENNEREYELYKKMYYKLFNAITDVLDMDIPEEAAEKLKNTQILTEEIYIEG